MENKVSQILDLVGSRLEIAAECGVEPIAVYRWRTAGSIPSKHLPGVLRVSKRNKAGVTAEALCEAHEVSPTTAPSSEAAQPGGSRLPVKPLDAGNGFQGGSMENRKPGASQ